MARFRNRRRESVMASRGVCCLQIAARSGLWLQQLRETEVVALELRISHLAIAPKIDSIKAAAKSLQVTVRRLRRKLRKHRPPQLEAFVGEVVAVMVVINHHQRHAPVMK